MIKLLQLLMLSMFELQFVFEFQQLLRSPNPSDDAVRCSSSLPVISTYGIFKTYSSLSRENHISNSVSV